MILNFKPSNNQSRPNSISKWKGVDDPSMLLKFASRHPDFKKLT